MEESQAPTVLGDHFYDDPSQLSQALRERASSDRPFHFTTSTESLNTGNHAHSIPALAIPQQSSSALLHLPVVLAPFINALSPRRVATTKYVKPALLRQHSAPTATGNIIELAGALKMHHSFNGMDAPGDTQPDSQMLKTWTSGMQLTSEPNEVSVPRFPPKSLFIDHPEEDDDLPTDEMEIVASSQDHHMPTPTSPTAIDVDENGEPAQDSMAPTSPLKFQTPAFPGRKRASSGQILSSAARTNTTPGTAASASFFNFPGGNGDAQNLSLTQAFNNTQAPTSPVVGGALEDVVFTRPSPNFTNMRHSSPIPAYSSPIKAMRTETPKSDPIVRSSSEPRAEYVTMKQSQEKREPSMGDEGGVVTDQDSWQELSRRVRAQKAREQTHREAAVSLSHISAPAPIPSRSGRKRIVNAEYPSPVQSRTSRSGAHNGSHDDENSADEDTRLLQAKENHDEDAAHELLHSTPSTARTVAKDNSTANSVQVPKTSSHPRRIPSAQPSRNSSQQTSPSSQLQRESQLQEPASQPLLRSAIRPHSSKDSVAVMDSQPDATADLESIPPPKSLRFPSSPSINQYSINQTTMATKTGYTSQVISSSIPPMPPGSSPEEEVTPEGEERVPSSPPLLIHEDVDGGGCDEGDLQYDEHTYDEYGEEEGDREATEPLAVDEDTVMDEDDDLPITKEESEAEATLEVPGEKSDEEGPDLIQPGKVDLGADQEVPETYPETQPDINMDDEAQSQHNGTVDPPQLPRMRRQDTVPETDALDETQPSFFPDDVPREPINDDTAMAGDTNSTGLFQTAEEEQPGSQSNRPAPLSSKEPGSDIIQGGNRIRSIDDIYNLPETQPSAVEEEFEMPRLSGLEDNEEGPFVTRSSAAPPSAKRRKVAYAAKSKVFRPPPKENTDSEALSDPRPSPRHEQMQQALEDTPPTAWVREREDQGAHAAARVREEAQASYTRTTSLKSKALPKPTKPQAQRKGALKPISRELLQSLSSPANSPARSKGPNRSRATTPQTPTKSREVVADMPADIGMLDAKAEMPVVDEEPEELVSSAPPPTNIDMRFETPSQRTEISPEDIVVPNRVFASWPGSHYYPATCIGRTTSGQLQIRYDDNNITSMDAVHVRAMDLRTGDHVKVDETGFKKNIYIVVGFKDRIDVLNGEEFPTTDRRGYKTVILEERPRESMSKERLLQPPEHIPVPMVSVYLTTGLWKRLRDRSFNFSPPVSPVKAVSHIGTPIADPLTTLSFTRRGTAVPSLLKSTTTRAASVASTTRSGTGVFTNMAFVLTSTTADVDKEAMARSIKSNGGQVLEHGFHELFDQSDSPDAPESSQSCRRSASAVEGSVGLALKHQYKDLGFVALISDSHSRSTKYIQALALNVPCLHLRWMQDSFAASRAAPFTRYLLPAGVSKFLDPNGVVRSRTMAPYDPAGDDVSFSQTIQDRDLLFHDQSILLVTGKSKKEVEKRQPFVFLSHALGSANVGLCTDLAVAAEMLADGNWDWVYVDNGERGVAEAAAELFGTEKPAASGKAKKGKKRKRDDSVEEKEELLIKGDVAGKQVRITCAEFVIQSLILGALVEE